MTRAKIKNRIYVSAVLVAIGVFLPLTSLPVYGDVTYNGVAEFESYVVVALAILGPLLIVLNRAKLILVSSGGIWLTLLFPSIQEFLAPEGSSFLGDFANSAASVMQDFAADLFLNIAEFSWGGFVFLLGLLVYTMMTVLLFLKGR